MFPCSCYLGSTMYSGWVLILRHVLKGAEKNLQNINVVPQYNTNSTYLNVCRQTPTLEMFRCALQGLKPSQVLLLPISQQEVHGNHPLPPRVMLPTVQGHADGTWRQTSLTLGRYPSNFVACFLRSFSLSSSIIALIHPCLLCCNCHSSSSRCWKHKPNFTDCYKYIDLLGSFHVKLFCSELQYKVDDLSH